MAFDFVESEVFMDNISKNNSATENPVSVTKKSKRFEITVDDFIRIVRENKKLYCISAIITFILAIFIYLFYLKPVYDIDSSIEIRSSQGGASISPFDMMAQFVGGVASNNKSIDFELLRSRTLMDAVIEKNNLQMKVRKKNNTMFSYYWSKFVTGDVSNDVFVVFKKFPDSLKLEKGSIVANEDGYTIEHGGEKRECGWDADCVFKGGVVVLEKLGTFNIPVEYVFSYVPVIDTREWVSKSFNVVTSSSSDPLNLKGGVTEFLKLVFTHESPIMAAKVLDDLVEAYILKKKEWEKKDVASKNIYISGMLEELSLGIEEKAQKMIMFQHKENTIVPELEFPELLKKQEALKVQSEEFKFKRKILENSLDSIEKKPGKPITVPIEEPSVQEALKYHNALLFKRNELSQRVTAEHPLKVAADEEIKESENALKNVIKTSVSQYAKGEKLIDELLGMMSEGKEKLPENLITFANLKRDVELAERVYLTLSAKLYESSISPDIGVDPLRVIDAPTTDVLRSFPKSKSFVVITLIATILSGLVVVFVKEFFKAAKEILK